MAGVMQWGWCPETEKWVKLRVDADGSFHVVGYIDSLDDIGDVELAGIADDDILYWDAPAGDWLPIAHLGVAAAHHARYLDAEAVDAVEAAGLILAALKKIIYANDGLAQFGTLDGSPTVRGGRVAYPSMLIVQPKDGNTVGEIMVMPKGTEDYGCFCAHNAESLVDYGWVDFNIDGDQVFIAGSKVGTGTAPVRLRIDFDTCPVTDRLSGLGDDNYRWKHVKALHHEIMRTLPADHTWSGLTAQMPAGTALTIGQACHVGGDSKMEKALATAAATMPAIALATGTIAEDATGEFLLQGYFIDLTWDWTPGGLLYISKDTAGALTQTLPAASGEQVQVVGVAITADTIYFNPSLELVEIS